MNQKRNFYAISLAALGLILSTACLWPSVATSPELAGAVTQTWDALNAFNQQETADSIEADDESQSDEQPTPTVTPTSGPPMLRVSVDTNCRFGPGLEYEYLGALMTYETAEVLARSSLPGFWVIENPDWLGTECWVGEQYATIEGDTSHLPVREPPPLPEPEFGSISGYVYIDGNNNNQRGDPQDGVLIGAWVYLEEGDCPGGPQVMELETDNQGYYIFPDVPPGTYCVTRHNFQITTFPDDYEIILGEGEHLSEINFRFIP